MPNNSINMKDSTQSVVVSGDGNVINVNQPAPSSAETPELPPPPTDRNAMPPPCKMTQRHRMPYRSIGNAFVGKIGEIWQLHDILQGNSKVAVIDGVGLVVGMGGLGKTQLAIEYAHRFAMCYPGGIFWVYAEQGFLTVPGQILQGAREISVDPKSSPKDQLDQIWTGLSRSGLPALMIYDNFSENEALQSWLPHSPVISVLITTRRRDLSKYQPVELQTLSADEGIELLNSRAGKRKFGKEAEKLIVALGGLPLAIEIMGHVLQQRTDISIDKLSDEMKRLGDVNIIDNFAKKYKDDLPSGHAKEISATIQMSWNIASPMAKTVLQVMSLLAPAPVPRRLIRKILEVSSESILDDPVDEAISESVSLSLADTDQDADPALHRLIHGFAKLTIEKDSELPQKTVNAVLNEVERIGDDFDTAAYRELEKIVIHADSLLGSDCKEAADISNYLWWYHWKHGDYQLAAGYEKQSLKIAQDLFKPENPEIALRQSNLALVLKDLGEYEEAAQLFRQALESAEKNFEPGHPSIATYQSTLASVLQDLGAYEEAAQLLRMALESAEKNFEPGHPTIAKLQSNLALVLKDLGAYEEAAQLLRMALDSDKKNFEPGHPTIAIRQSNLALVLKKLGDYEEAAQLSRLALDSDKKNFEPGHPSIARSQSNLALVLQDLGAYEEAAQLSRLALDSDKKNFEPGHPNIAINQSNLAMVLKDLGDYEEAAQLLRMALDSAKKNFKPGHPSIARSQSNLASVLYHLKEYEEAQELLQQAYTSFLNKLGADHPDTKNSLGWLNGVIEARDLNQD